MNSQFFMIKFRQHAKRSALSVLFFMATFFLSGFLRVEAVSSYKVNAGGGAATPFTADIYSAGGSTSSTTAAIDTSGVVNPAPQAVYQTEHYASNGNNFSYTLPGLTAGASYTVRLHFAEIFVNGPGQREFNVFINGQSVLHAFDIYATTGAKNKAVVEEFPAIADANGNITLNFNDDTADCLGSYGPKVSGIEVQPYSFPYYAVNAGGGTVAPYVSDTNFSGGATSSTTAAIDTSGVVNPAPQAVYQTEHYASNGNNFSYTLPGLTAGASYTVRLHFAEIFVNGPGQREFNVFINGQSVLHAFDIYATTGAKNKAVVEEFPAIADVNGNITLNFNDDTAEYPGSNGPKVSGIELVSTATAYAISAGKSSVPTPDTSPSYANPPFTADMYSTGGSTSSTTAPIDTSGVINPAPQAVYQTEHYASNGNNFSYTLPGLTAGASYTVRLHFAEIFVNGPGQREFNVFINGQSVLHAFDIYATTGAKNKAVVEEFPAIADVNGNITLNFNDDTAEYPGSNGPKVSGIEVVGLASQVGQWSSVLDWGYGLNSASRAWFIPIHMHVLPNGKVLGWARDVSDPQNPTAACDPTKYFVWDPTSVTANPTLMTSAALSSPPAPQGYATMVSCLFCSGHSFLPDGRLLVTGGHISDGRGMMFTNIFNPVDNTWATSLSSWNMTGGRWYPTNCSLPNGEIVVVAGSNETNAYNSLPQVWQTNGGGGWRSLTTAQTQWNQPQSQFNGDTFSNHNHYYPWLHVAPNGKVFMSGPGTLTGYLDTSGTGQWTAVANTNSLDRGDDLGSSVMYNNGKVLIVGGASPAIGGALTIDLNATTPAWQATGTPNYPRQYLNTTILPDGTVLATGGNSNDSNNHHRSTAGAVFAAESWNPTTGYWSIMASNHVPRQYHSTAVLLPDGRVLAGGGGAFANATDIDNFPNVEIYSPPYLFRGARPTISSAPTSVTYAQTFSVSTPDAASIASAVWIRLSSVTHAFNENQRINRLTFTANSGTLSITAPSDRNLCPPGHYMLFILNKRGVPSVAKIIQII